MSGVEVQLAVARAFTKWRRLRNIRRLASGQRSAGRELSAA